ncbi:MAG: bifunctional (p)ppGpp synthetase/guanosine-3',5'-bis(diphosphate) 3'-pyrophosphohydrolase [Dactylosporangium sp.]|nr:HD domain-containing protein [Dactylosporangium sp.]NNJ62959.1 bifunctional (p)ppGpp synthetase/guanosine-3',5'-bis(diphosphate) 3'-pyrophosphohydrolase [Dactylosporangium sp.]
MDPGSHRIERRPNATTPEPPLVTPTPPNFATLGGGALPGDRTPTYSNAISQRLRAMLPWSTADDPVTMLIRTHRAIHPSGDGGLLRRAYSTAEQMHRGQMRKSGEPYITHPLSVAQICADLGMDTTTLVAALLHDTVEDTKYTLAALESDFGSDVAIIVDGVTKFDKVFYGQDAEVETIRKLIVMAGRDVRVLVIKLADRLHNMRTLDARSTSSQVRIAKATQDVLIPLCDRLGIQALKRELDDWVLRALSPDGYARVIDYFARRKGRTKYLAEIIAQVNTELDQFRIDATITPRERHLYSIWKDTVAGGHPEPYDLPRIIIVVDGPDTDCYAALGAVHGRWRPVPGRFKDFIASPKNNLYRSLHTTVIGSDDTAVEVLIRTEAMHRTSEYGIIANFRYPQHAASFGPAAQAEQLEWLHRLLDWQGAATDPAQFLDSLRCALAEAQIIVFTSTGRPVLLPADATPIDLAYTLGADVGHRCVGARLNGRLVPLSSILNDGDVVEIMTRPGQRDEFDFDDNAPAPGPSVEWLQLVKTPHARLHISRWFSDRKAPASTIAHKVRLGRAAIGLALRQKERGLASDLPLLRLLPHLGYPDLETLLVAVADHKISADAVVETLIALVDQTPH